METERTVISKEQVGNVEVRVEKSIYDNGKESKEYLQTILSDENGIDRYCEIIQPGRTIESYSPVSVKVYKGSIGTALVTQELLDQFKKLIDESPTGCVYISGSSYGGTYYFRDDETFWSWRDGSNTHKTSDYPGASNHSGIVESIGPQSKE